MTAKNLQEEVDKEDLTTTTGNYMLNLKLNFDVTLWLKEHLIMLNKFT